MNVLLLFLFYTVKDCDWCWSSHDLFYSLYYSLTNIAASSFRYIISKYNNYYDWCWSSHDLFYRLYYSCIKFSIYYL